MKAQAEPVDLIGMAAVIVVMILIAGVFERDTIFAALQQVAIYTGKAVAWDIAGVLTISAAAPGDITINYAQSAKYAYAVDVKDRKVSVTVTSGNVQGGVSGQADMLINIQASVTDCNHFSISKQGGNYNVKCTGKFTPVQ